MPTAEVRAISAKRAGGDAGFDPDRMADEIWDAKVIPYLEARAGALKDEQVLARSDPAAAGAKYGYRPNAEGAPWTLATRIEGRIVAADTTSRAATVEIDIDGDGKPDATVQIGPAVRGTALRDVLSFVSFNDFTNQIDFARFGKALNTHADRTVLSKLPRQDLVGRSVTVLGAYPLQGDPDRPVLVTPATISIGPKP